MCCGAVVQGQRMSSEVDKKDDKLDDVGASPGVDLRLACTVIRLASSELHVEEVRYKTTPAWPMNSSLSHSHSTLTFTSPNLEY